MRALFDLVWALFPISVNTEDGSAAVAFLWVFHGVCHPSESPHIPPAMTCPRVIRLTKITMRVVLIGHDHLTYSDEP